MMSSWIEELKENLATEFGKKPVIATLATVRNDSSADARSVVIRNLSEEGRLLISSDARSQKNKQLKMNSSATIVLWLPTLRKQFRIDGQMTVLADADPLRLLTWRASSDSSRAQFFWPPAGQPRVDGEFPRSTGVDQPMPPSFEVLQLLALHVDVLELAGHPHRRAKWSQKAGVWSDILINP